MQPPDPPTPDRPGTPEQFDREEAWSRFYGTDQIMRDALFAELDAAVAWATARERERSAKIADAECKRSDQRANELQADGHKPEAGCYRSRAAAAECIAAAIRSDPDAPAPTTKE